MRLILIRHGESEHARRQVIVGFGSCPGLTNQGLDQAHRLVKRFGATGELAACSLLLPMRHARQTAEILAEAPHLLLAEPYCDLCGESRWDLLG